MLRIVLLVLVRFWEIVPNNMEQLESFTCKLDHQDLCMGRTNYIEVLSYNEALVTLSVAKQSILPTSSSEKA